MEQGTFKFRVLSIAWGWCSVRMLINDKEVTFNASYLGINPLESLIDACAELKEDPSTYYITWQKEPGSLNIKLNLDDEILQLDISYEKVSINDKYEEIKTIEIELHEKIPFNDFLTAIRSEGYRVLNALGLCGYRRSWQNDTDFPLTNLLRISGIDEKMRNGESFSSELSDEIECLRNYISEPEIVEKSTMDRCTIYYESWQLQCCGDPFSVGDKVEWTGTLPHGFKYAHGTIIDYEEEHHGFATLNITGTITRYIAERSEFPIGERGVVYDKAKTIKEDLHHANGCESDLPDDETTERTFWGYIVELEDVTVTPLEEKTNTQ